MEDPEVDSSEYQSEEPVKEKTTPIVTRTGRKRTATDAEVYEQTTIPAMAAAKRLKVEKEDRTNMNPAKTVGYHIKETKPIKVLTRAEAFEEMHLTVGHMRLKKGELATLGTRYDELYEIIKDSITDPRKESE